MTNSLSQTLRILIVASLPFAIVLTNVRLLMFPWFLNLEYNKAGFPADINIRPGTDKITKEQRQEYAEIALEYLVNDAEIEFLGELEFPNGEPMYDARELQHMLDVKVVTQWTLRVWLLASLISIGASVALAWQPQTRQILRSGLSVGSLIVVGVLLALVLYILLNFNSFFTRFHLLFFESGTFLFYFDDTLIRLFPLKFWSDIFTLIGVSSLVEGILVWLGAWRFLR